MKKKTLLGTLAGVAASVAVAGGLFMSSAFAAAPAKDGTQIEAHINGTYAVSKHTARGGSVVLSLESHKGNVEALVEGCKDGHDLGEVKRFGEGVIQAETLVQHIEPGTCFKLVLTSDKNTTVKGTLRH